MDRLYDSSTPPALAPEHDNRRLAVPPPGFGPLEVPEMPAYVGSYVRRGGNISGDATPVYQQMRFGYRKGIGGMGGYASVLETPEFFEGYRQKRGNAGVFQSLRWAPGCDSHTGNGIAGLSELRNHPGLMTRGGDRRGGPRRQEVMERAGYWFEKARPGVATSRYSQINDGFAGIRQRSQRTPALERATDPFVLREMIEHNPWHINSHSAMQAKTAYDKEFGGPVVDRRPKGYQDNRKGGKGDFGAGETRYIVDDDPRVGPEVLADGRPNV
mmetsp:Transcript_17654/g.44792  ORF Transcript_17654/g.44792 Transcript_17654/m.44792 type:complete len:271 (-) Transcript_17654:521-1333(-)